MSYTCRYLCCFLSFWFISCTCTGLLNPNDFFPSLSARVPLPHQSKLLAAQDDTCSLVSCVSKGQSCAADFINNATSCNSGNATCCASPLLCYQGSCIFDSVGSFCNTSNPNAQCVASQGERLTCINNACVYQGSANDGCNQNTDCLGLMQCVNGLCQGLSDGSNCTVEFLAFVGEECSYGNVCIGGFCIPWLTTGDYCNGSSICEFGTFCHEETMKCENMFSVSNGGACDFGFECFDGGAACINGTCVDTNNWATCSSVSECTTGFNCTCDKFVGESLCIAPPEYTPNPITSCIKDNALLIYCLRDNQCSFPLSYTNQHTSSCANQHCLFEVDNAIGCNCQYQKSYIGNCLYNDTCSVRLLRDWQIALIVIGGIVLIAIIIAVIVIAVKRSSKRAQYDKV